MDNSRIYNAMTAFVGVLMRKALKFLGPKLQEKLANRIAYVSVLAEFIFIDFED